MNYYKKQLLKVVTPPEAEYSPQFQVKSVGGNTKWMDLNLDSAEALREWLDEKYPKVDEQYKKSEL